MGKQMRRKMILDLDTGIDDALALSYAAGHRDIELLGVTNVFGNVTVDEAVQNTLNFLHLLKKDHIPVYRGSACAFNADTYEPPAISRTIHGANGVGGITLPPSARQKEGQDAVDFLIDSIKCYGPELTIVATSPLTNIARVFEKAPEAAAQLGRLVIMGGAVTVPGNVTPFAEANILGDPQAAKRVFDSGCPITLVGLDVTLRTLLTPNETKQMRSWGTCEAEKIAEMIEYYFGAYKGKSAWISGCPLHDPLAVGIALDETLARTLPLYLMVETEGVAKGRTIGDRTRLMDSSPNVSVCIEVDAARFLHSFMDVMQQLTGNQGGTIC